MEIVAKMAKEIWARNSYLIGLYLRLNGKQKEVITCKGYNLPTNKKQWYRFYGDFTVDENGRKSFEVSYFEAVYSNSIGGMKQFLKGEEFDGIPKSVIDELIGKYGFELIDMLKDRPYDIKSPCLTKEYQQILINGFKLSSALKDTKLFLQPIGIPDRVARMISEKYGSESVDIIKNNPYQLMEIESIGFVTCETIARYLNVCLTSKDRIKYGILNAIYENNQAGDTYVVDEDLINKTHKKLNDGFDEELISKKSIIEVIASLIKSSEIRNEGNKIFNNESITAEERVAMSLAALSRRKVQNADKMVNTMMEIKDDQVTEKQLIAVRNALSNSISVITGGAGTGKTTIIKLIIETYRKCNPNSTITLLAPTGKASRRMSEATGYDACTIHQRLQLFGGDEPKLRITEGLIIVDEFSMVGILLLDKLLRAINTSRCQVLFVGDINQLQSVEQGACLKDIIESKKVVTTKLTEIFRQKGGLIIDNSLKIVDKKTDLKFDKSTMMCVDTEDENSATDTLLKIYRYYVSQKGIENVAVITPLKRSQERFVLCADELNKKIQEAINTSEVSCNIGGKIYKLNDRVMMLKNTESASNGDVGTITCIDTENDTWGLEITVEWENGNTCKYHKKDMDNITLAYAMTVHKSQGSQYPVVIIPIMSDQKCRLFQNNLFYTALTRTEDVAIIVNDKKSALDQMITNSSTYSRKTTLKNRIQKYC